MVILGGYYGEGKFAGMYNSFLMGVSAPPDETSNEKKFLSVVSVGTGLTIEKVKELYTKLKPHWTKERPSIVVGPKVTFL